MYENVQGRRSYLRNVQAMSLATGLLYTGLMWAACTALWTALKVFGILYLVFGLPSRYIWYLVFGLPSRWTEHGADMGKSSAQMLQYIDSTFEIFKYPA